MPSTALRFVEVVLTWSATESGTTAVLQQQSDGGWREVAHTDGAEYTVEGSDPERAHGFAAAAIDEDDALAPEQDWETVRVAPMADTGTPALPATPSDFAASPGGANLNIRWDAGSQALELSDSRVSERSW